MCISLIAHKTHPEYRLILAFNRDENHSRPTEPLGYWKDNPSILAGRDLKAEGTWLGVSRSGKFANVTNYRDLRIPYKKNAPSRGQLISQFLTGTDNPENFLEEIQLNADQYNRFSLIIGDSAKLYYFSNIENKIRELSSGICGLSNHLLDTPWPKVECGKKRLAKLIANKSFHIDEIFNILSDKTIAEDSNLPDTGFGRDFERVASPLFVVNQKFGTRSSSVILIDYQGRVSFSEKTFDKEGNIINAKNYNIKIKTNGI